MKKKKKTFYATPQASKKSLRETREIVRAQKYDAERISLDLHLLVRPQLRGELLPRHAPRAVRVEDLEISDKSEGVGASKDVVPPGWR